MKAYLRNVLPAAALLGFAAAIQAEDIDLFVGYQPTSAYLPDVMIVLDNAANFSSNAAGGTCVINGTATALSGTVGGIEQCALYKVISELPVPTVNGVEQPQLRIGMMVYNANNIRDVTNSNCGDTVGGCLVQPLMLLNTANKTAFLNWIRSWKTTGGAGDGYVAANSEATGAAMQETWAYYAGRTGLSGRVYSSDPAPIGGCGKNYIIFVGNSYSSSGTPGDATGNSGPKNALEGTNSTSGKNALPAATTAQKAIITNTLSTSCGSYTFPSSAHENKGFYADEWARYVASQDIVTYTIGVLGASCQAEYAGLLTNMADYGGGKYYPTTNYNDLVLAFQQILSEIQSVNSVFASVSLPVSVNTQGTFLNQVFIGMFRPDKDAYPRWAGNLKQYKIGYDNANTLRLLDADGIRAISAAGTGFVAECARSFWTPLKTAPDTYWSWIAKANCEGYAAASNTPDGNMVEKGAEGYTLRGVTPGSRTVKTCNSDCSGVDNFVDSNTTLYTNTLLGSGTDNDPKIVINWERGLNNHNDETFTPATDMRPSVHGDVVHSRPVAVNYGTDDAAGRKVVAFYGGNDGVLRAINGNREDGPNIGSVTPGSELWAFVPPEFYDKIVRLRNNDVQISYKGSVNAAAKPKPYGFDGPVTAYKGATQTWIYATMRRGGRSLYAFDVSDLTATPPTSPTKISGWAKVKVGCPNGYNTDGTPNNTGCTSTNFEGIGQTWSSPKVMKATGFGSGASPLLIMGGGYDPCEDYDAGTSGGANHSCVSTSTGDQIYVLDAATGAVEKMFDLGTGRGIAGDVTVVPDSSGKAKWAYAADLAGNVWRISGATANTPIGSSPPANWTITKIASLGCETVSPCTANRKFLFAPDVVEESGYYYILLGSGDREKPLEAYTAAQSVANRFFMIKDKPQDGTWLSAESETCGAAVICTDSLLPIAYNGADPTQAQLASKPKGWYLTLRAHPEDKNGDPILSKTSNEQVVTGAITLFGTVTFSTHQASVPDEQECTVDLGTARVYNVKYLNAAASGNSRSEDIQGGGLPPSPVAGLVTLDNGETVPFVIGASPDSAIEVAPPPGTKPGSASQPKSRVYWYIQR